MGGLKHDYYLMRHGQSEANVQKIICSNPSIGVASFGLTNLGRKQAMQSSTHFITSTIPPSNTKDIIIYTSDFLRAYQTAQILGSVCKCHVIKTEALRERFFGDHDLKSDTNYQITWGNDAKRQLEHNEESPVSVAARVKRLIEKIEQDVAKPSIVVLVAHGDTCQMTQALFARLPPWDHRKLKHLETAEVRFIGRPLLKL
ncbi:hypothetical protein SmJEL517_g00343 [Synchytrium microbalum]|uniref:Phosphoglycerate mutase (2,3-diphosphoglycerate-dependent) n=1 Tax=Synchytrium microbalum TaxID=1806994 RepID=A0A507CJA3_9FUNG|nr:uncharacterized protein SmJEL517_g00343 [Synchytrium microbalum]TPX38356.1 hypothetical protein SmJEL517_g00343 [Synchytrium microbalum]